LSEPGKEGCKDYQDRVERNKGFVLNQERKDLRIGRITLKGKKWLFLNQERKDEKISKILPILVSFLSWFKDKKSLVQKISKKGA